eukprot:gene2087-1959_t
MDHKEDPLMYHQSREVVDKRILDQRNTGKISDTFCNAGNKIQEKVDPIVNFVKTSITEEIEDLGASDLDTFWNHEARDVSYLENVKNQIEREQFEKDLETFKSKKCKEVSSISNDHSMNPELIQ